MKTAYVEHFVVLRDLEERVECLIPARDETSACVLAGYFARHHVPAWVEARDVSEMRIVEPQRCGALIQPYVWCGRSKGHAGGHSSRPDREEGR